jgi:hypothetical protein
MELRGESAAVLVCTPGSMMQLGTAGNA